jgi:hypothetical protein
MSLFSANLKANHIQMSTGNVMFFSIEYDAAKKHV